MNSNNPILLVEDDQVDAMTVERAFRDLEINNELIHAVNGLDALDHLRDGSKEPSLILLDINMPRMNGIEFLRELKSNDRFKRIPVVVLTTSNDQKDKFETYDLGISGYMLKPIDYQAFVSLMREINNYWTLSEAPN